MQSDRVPRKPRKAEASEAGVKPPRKQRASVHPDQEHGERIKLGGPSVAPPMEILDREGIEAICARIASGQTYRAICAELGISNQARLAYWLEADKDRAAQAKAARRLSALAADEEAERVILEAQTPLDLAKARELASHYRWRASKRDPAGHGDRIQVDTAPDDLTRKTEDQLKAEALALAAKLGLSITPREEPGV